MHRSSSRPSGKFSRRLLGSFALLLGIFGTGAGLAGLVGVWTLASSIHEPVHRVFTGVTELGSQLENNALEATRKIEDSRTIVRELDAELEQKIEQWLQGLEIDPQWIHMLSQRLQHLAQRVEDWRAIADLAEELIGQALGLVEGAAVWLQADLQSIAELRTAIDQGQQEVHSLLDLFENLEGEIITLLANEPPPASEANRTDTLFLRIDQTLGLLMTHCTTFAEAVHTFEDAAEQLQKKILRLTNRIALILSLLLCWHIAAQGCLGFCGWRLVRPAKKTTSKEPDPT